MKILLVEDDYLFAETIRDNLRREFRDASVDIIESESLFLERLKTIDKDPPSVIVLDMFLPFSEDQQDLPPTDFFRGGQRCLNALRADNRARQIPVILHSAGSVVPPDLPSNVVCVPKSGNPVHLLTALRSVLFSKRTNVEQKVFIVHGHDGYTKEIVARFLEKLGLRAVVLQEQPNRGHAIFEKLEAHSDASFAVVLLTADDVGSDKQNTASLKPRARQNVILELGYFIGRLGKNRVCALIKDAVEIPSDYHGVLYIKFDSDGAWRTQLAAEMSTAGVQFDPRKLM